MTPPDCCPHCGDDLHTTGPQAKPHCPSPTCQWVTCPYCNSVVVVGDGSHACHDRASCNARLPRGRWSL